MSQDILSLIIVLVIAVVFLTDKLPIAVVAMGGAMVCGAFGLIDYPAVFSGLAGTTSILLMSMMIVGSAMFHTGLATRISQLFVKFTGTSEVGIMISVMVLSALMSSICNNVGVVVTLLPITLGMCKRTRISPSRILMPLGYGAAVGGIITLVGTASTVTANGLLEESGITAFGFFEFAWVGIPLMILSVIYMVTLGRKLLPNYDYDYDFDSIQEVTEDKFNKTKMWISGIVVIAVVIVMAIQPKGLPLYMTSSFGALVLILTGCISEKQAYQSISWPTIVIAGGMIAVSSAVSKSGGGDLIAGAVTDILGANANPYFITAIILFVVTVMTQFLSNVSTAALMTPIAIFIAQGIGANPRTMAMIVAIAANASFMTPVGTQSLTTISEPGKYKFIDFVKVGTPITIFNFIIGLVIIPLVWPF